MQNTKAHSLKILALPNFLVAEAYSAEDAISLAALRWQLVCTTSRKRRQGMIADIRRPE